jgi:thiamine-phosphate pyrophosphorylase
MPTSTGTAPQTRVERRTGHAIRGLYAVTPGIGNGYLLRDVELALQGGARIVQFRDKSGGPSGARSALAALRNLTSRHRALLIVNDDPALAMQVDADGVHVGGSDAPIDGIGALCALRRRNGEPLVVGVSCYADLDRARRAVAQGAAYVAFGSFHASKTKPSAALAPVEILAAAKRELKVPVVAIGGITRGNAPELIAAGADAVAVISDLFDADDVKACAADFSRLFRISYDHDQQE